MIHLFVVLLFTGSVNAKGWLEGDYGTKLYSYPSITACEAARARMVKIASTLERGTETLISKCAADKDVVEYRVYHGKPASAPPVFDETPKPPSKPNWHESA